MIFCSTFVTPKALSNLPHMILLYIILGILVLILSYFIIGSIIPLIPINRLARPHWGEESFEIYLKSDGVHADIILPVKNQLADWRRIIDPDHFEMDIDSDKYFAFGWGDRGFYLEIPEWKDLTFQIAFRAMCMPSPTVMHVTAYEQLPTEFKYFTKLKLSREQYLRIVDFISSYFQYKADKPILIEGAGYGPNDQFYETYGKYHAFITCNEWVNKSLKYAKVRTAIWSPPAFGLFIHHDRREYKWARKQLRLG